MADPAPSAPLPDAAPERRVSPADQMAALTGEPVELSQPEDDEPAEDRDASTGRADRRSCGDGALRELRQPRPRQHETRARHASDSARTPVSPPAARTRVLGRRPARHATPPNPTPPPGAKPQQGQTSPVAPSSPKAQDHPNEASRSPQGAAPLNGAAMVAAALTGGLRRAEPPAPPLPPRSPSAAASSDARAPRPPSSIGSPSKASSTTFAGRRRRLPRLSRRRRPARPPRPPPQPRLRRTPRRPRLLPLPAVSATSLASSPPTACKPGATPKRSRAPPRLGPLFLPRWRRWNGRRRPASS